MNKYRIFRLILSISLFVNAFLLAQQPIAAQSPALVISEFMAANQKLLADEDGDYGDWLELHNRGATPINLAGYHLTDDPADLNKWAFPSVEIPADGYLLIFASGKNRTTIDSALHTGFKLSRESGYLALVDPDETTIVDEFSPYPIQKPTISYGISGDNIAFYYETPTPGTANAGTVYSGAVEPLTLSHARGFYSTPFNLTLATTTPDAKIRYTLDGTLPSPTQGTLYDGPIPVTTTTLLKAVAYRDSWLPTDVIAHTYLFLGSVIQQTGAGFPTAWGSVSGDYEMDPEVVNNPLYSTTITDDLQSIPSLSLIMNQEDLFGSNGIYTAGEGIRKPVSVEWLDPTGTNAFQINGAVHIFGGSSPIRWKMMKLSMRLTFDELYGPNKLDYPVFGAEGPSQFKTLVLDARMNNTWAYGGGVDPVNQRQRGQYVRDQYAADLQRAVGSYGPRGQHIHLYLNGLYWGIYTLHERPDEHFAEFYFGGKDDAYDVIKHKPSDIVNGANTHYTALFALAEADLAVDANYQAIAPLLDIDDFIRYMLMNFYIGNIDWAHHNWYATYNPTDPNGRWRYHSWDAEKGLHNLNDNSVIKDDANGPTHLHQRLMLNADYRLRFADEAHKHFFNGGVLTPSQAASLYQSLLSQVDRAVVAESARWGDTEREAPYTRDLEWVAERERLLNTYFPQRTAVVLQQLQAVGAYPLIAAPSFNQPFSQQVGEVTNGFELTIAAPQGTIYYTTNGDDPRQAGGAVSDGAKQYSGGEVITHNTTVKARALHNGAWSALNQATFLVRRGALASASNLLISEVHYNPDGPDGYEFIEFKNVSAEEIDLTQVAITSGVFFTFPLGTSLLPNQQLVVVEDRAKFETRYREVNSPWYYPNIAVAGQWTDRLRNEGEALAVHAEDGSEILRFTYNDKGSWPGRADGDGSAMELKNPSEVPTTQPEKDDFLAIGNKWQPTREYRGTPGRDGAGPDNRVVINELLSQSTLPLLDTIELYNTTAEAIDLSGWFLSDSSANYHKYRIPDGTSLPANGFITFDEGDFNDIGNPHSLTPFALNSMKGDDIYLVAADSAGNLHTFVDRVEFVASAPNTPFGRWPDGSGSLYPMLEKTLGSANMSGLNNVRVGQVVIAEIHYNPSGSDENLEFIELYNAGIGSENLENWRLRGEVDYNFGSDVILKAGHTLLLVGFDPDDTLLTDGFRTHYNLDGNVPLLGPWTDNGSAGFKLDNGGAILKLQRPSDLVTPLNGSAPFHPMLIEDTVSYDDESPWPLTPDGDGPSLERTNHTRYGDEAVNWLSSQEIGGTPGRVAPIHMPGDVNCDGRVTAVDGSFILQHDVSLRSKIPHCPLPSGALYTSACDVNSDSQCGIWDGVLILKCDVGLANVFCPVIGGAAVGRTDVDASMSDGGAVINVGTVEAGATSTVTVSITADLPDLNLSVLSAKVSYDPTRLHLRDCLVNPNQAFDFSTCNVNFEIDGVGLDALRFNAVSLEGISSTESVVLAELIFDVTGPVNEEMLLAVEMVEFDDADGVAIPVVVQPMIQGDVVDEGGMDETMQEADLVSHNAVIFLPLVTR